MGFPPGSVCLKKTLKKERTVSEEQEPTPERLQDDLRKIERIAPLTQEEESQLVHQFVRGRA
jgi:hypothetical protein